MPAVGLLRELNEARRARYSEVDVGIVVRVDHVFVQNRLGHVSFQLAYMRSVSLVSRQAERVFVYVFEPHVVGSRQVGLAGHCFVHFDG